MRTCAFVVGICCLFLPTSSAFVLPRDSSVASSSSLQDASLRRFKSGWSNVRPLHLSDVPQTTQEELTTEDSMNRWFPKLPPPPEDLFVMSGDLVALFVYAFCDHFLCNDIAKIVVQQQLAQVSGEQQLLLSEQDMMPVWWNLAECSPFFHSTAGGVLEQALADRIVVQYSPLLQPTGLAACLLASSWLLAGWLHRAFHYDNTLLCRSDQALIRTAQTWVTCSIILLSAVYLQHMACGCPVIHLKKGDVGYILDSLTVLGTWRFMVAHFLGAGGSDDQSG